MTYGWSEVAPSFQAGLPFLSQPRLECQTMVEEKLCLKRKGLLLSYLVFFGLGNCTPPDKTTLLCLCI